MRASSEGSVRHLAPRAGEGRLGSTDAADDDCPPKKIAARTILFLLVGGIVGVLLLTLSFALPTGRIGRNLASSAEFFGQESGTVPQLSWDVEIDKWTEAVMLTTASYAGDESALEKAMMVYSDTAVDGGITTDPIGNLTALLNGNPPSYEHTSYSRYWHGYIIFLRPLLVLFTYSEIKTVLVVVHLSLLAAFLCLLARRQKRYVVPFAVVYLAMAPLSVALSLTLSIVINVTLVASIVLLRKLEWLLEDHRYVLLFLATGMATTFFDLLTYPLVSLGIPLVLLVVLTPEGSRRERMRVLVWAIVAWGVGYLGFWAEKLALGSILVQRNLFSEAISQALWRVSNLDNNHETITLLGVFMRNMGYMRFPYWAALLLPMVLAEGGYRRLKGLRTAVNADVIISLLVVSLLPFAWYAVMSNHSFVHCFLTNRALAITLFAWFCIPLSMFGQRGSSVTPPKRPLPSSG